MSKPNQPEKEPNVIKFPINRVWSFRIFVYLIMILVAIYLVFCIYKFVNGKNISTYQVKEGALTEQNTYTGIILRDEEVYHAESSGYYNYYLKEGEKASKNDLVYSIDGSGKIKDMMVNQTEDATTLTQDDLTEIKSEIVKFSKEYNDKDFTDVYDFKDDLASISLKMSNLFILDKISTLSLSGTNVNKYYCGGDATNPKTGYVVYYYDGYEEVNPEDVNSSFFSDDVNYERHMVSNNEIVSTGDFAYKLITSNNWKVVFPLSEEQATEFNNKEIKVKFSKNQEVVTGRLSVIDVLSPKKNASVEHMGVITFNNSVTEDTNTWEILWNTAYKGKITVKDSVRDTYFTAVMHVYKDELNTLKKLKLNVTSDDNYITDNLY